MRSLVLLIVVGCLARMGLAQSRMPGPVTVRWPDELDGDALVSLGLAFPKGAFTSRHELSFRAGRRNEVAQVEPLVCWPDGSARRVVAHAIVRGRAGAMRRLSFRLRDRRSHPATSAVVRDDGETLSIRGRNLSMDFGREPLVILNDLKRRGRCLMPSMRFDTAAQSAPVTLVVESAGPWMIRVRREERLYWPDGLDSVLSVVRVTVVDQLAEITVDAECRSEHAWGKRPALRICHDFPRPARGIQIGGQPFDRPDEAVVLSCDRDGDLQLEPAGREDPQALRPAMALAVAGGRLELCSDEFRGLGPSCLELNAFGETLAMTIVSSDYHWWGGVRPGRRLRIRLGVSGPLGTPAVFARPQPRA
ncbi:MAG: hypothetical protein KDB53_07435, partial [Planctomycetes bacterium]|nr:hypothetical protein [Planctomycetota bacterium]